jgi:hypothetical protein
MEHVAVVLLVEVVRRARAAQAGQQGTRVHREQVCGPHAGDALVRGSYGTFMLPLFTTVGAAAASPSRHRLPLSADQRTDREGTLNHLNHESRGNFQLRAVC